MPELTSGVNVRTEKVLVEGKVLKRAGRLRRPEQCQVFIRDPGITVAPGTI